MAVADAQNRRIDLGLLDLLPIDVSLMFGDVDDPPYRPQHAAIPLGEHMYAERIRPRVGRLVPCVRLIAAIHIAATGQREHGEYAAEQCANRSLQSPGNPADGVWIAPSPVFVQSKPHPHRHSSHTPTPCIVGDFPGHHAYRMKCRASNYKRASKRCSNATMS